MVSSIACVALDRDESSAFTIPTVVRATRIPMMQMTTRSSMSVKPLAGPGARGRWRGSVTLPPGLIQDPDVVHVQHEVQVLPSARPRGDPPGPLGAGREADARDHGHPVG